MTSHEYARKILEQPDLPIYDVNWDDYVDDVHFFILEKDRAIDISFSYPEHPDAKNWDTYTDDISEKYLEASQQELKDWLIDATDKQMLSGNYQGIEYLCKESNPEKMTIDNMMTLLVIGGWGKEKIPSYKQYFERCRASMINQVGDERANELLKGISA